MSADIDDQIEDYLAHQNQFSSDTETNKEVRNNRDKDPFWIAVIGGALINILMFFFIPFSFSLIGSTISGLASGGSVRRGIVAGFLSGLFSGIIIIILFVVGIGLHFSAFMLLVEMYTGISPLVVVCLMSIALGLLYGILGTFGGGVGGLISRLIHS